MFSTILNYLYTLLVIFNVIFINVGYADLPPTCPSKIYCHGDLLHTIQMNTPFNDSKTFVDLKIKESENDTLKNFNILMEQTNNNPTKEEIERFVEENFEKTSDLEEWTPPDFVEDPKFLKKIKDPVYRKLGKDIVALWKILSRKMKADVITHPELYSLIPVPNGFVIPGGRFKEIYYWDTYWIIRGLLISDMTQTAKGMIENLLFLVKKFGHVPNGSRVYYIQRSQPPLLTKMVQQYMNYTNDMEFLQKNIGTLDEELTYWLNNRTVRVKRGQKYYKMFQYNAASKGPRPESYREDVHTAKTVSDTQQLYTELKSGAESGWDFSSRWIFDENDGNLANLTRIHTTRVIPVDLNAILYDAFTIIADFYTKLNQVRKAADWSKRAIKLECAMKKVLWNETEGVWLDYDILKEKHRDYFYPSNVFPLITNCCKNEKVKSTEKLLKYLTENKIKQYPGGTPTSLIQSGEQWDFPNAWPPLQSFLVYGLLNTNNEDAKELATNLAQHWVRANFLGFNATDEMFEKYDSEQPGRYGGGGEYVVQAGFGWTNGVLLEFLNTFGEVLQSNLS